MHRTARPNPVPHAPTSRSNRFRRFLTAVVTVIATLALALGLVGALAGLARSQTTQVFSTDFESGVPAEFFAPGASIQGVQGFAGLGVPGNQFGGSFLRYDAPTLSDTKLVLRGLPPHDHVSVGFLLAVIDSWDGTEIYKISVDGQERFSNWFELASGNTTSYAAPPGVLLSSGIELGFSIGSYYRFDRAYDLSGEPAFLDIPHTADSLTVAWWISGTVGGGAPSWQGGFDESWAIENVRVSVTSSTAGVPGSAPGLALALEGPRPHPVVSGRMRVGFSLATDAPAALELLDLSGRRMAAREVGRLGAGRHVLDLSDGLRLAPGVYLVRLTQSQDTRVRRVVVL